MASHVSYRSLEQFRDRLKHKYLEIYQDNVVVQEKIHGSNVSIVGVKSSSSSSSDGWDFQLGSRRRWISDDERFNNIQQLFKNHKDQFISLFNNLSERFAVIQSDETPLIVRLYGEIFGGKYGGSTDVGAFKTQSEPNYCPHNDFAFFDAFVDDINIPIDDFIDTVPRFGLKIAPVIFRGPLSEFLSSFDVNSFNSVVSSEFYGLDFIETPKATEGVVIRSVNPKARGDEATILKYKQTWTSENPRLNRKRNNEDNFGQNDKNSIVFNDCLAMLNQNRLVSYKSKNTYDDLSNPRLLGTHIREIVDDTMKDIIEEFPPNKYPNLKHKDISKALSKKAFPMFMQFVEEIGQEALTPEERLEIISIKQIRLVSEINSLKTRLKDINERISYIQNM